VPTRWDNTHGLVVGGGAIVFGDGRVDAGSTRELELAAVGAGIDDIEVACALGRTGRVEPGEPLYEEVREATGASSGDFRAEARIPRPAESNPAQNWRADDVEPCGRRPWSGAGGRPWGRRWPPCSTPTEGSSAGSRPSAKGSPVPAPGDERLRPVGRVGILVGVRSGASWAAAVARALGFVLLVPVGLLYLVSGLVVPLPWTAVLWVLWLGAAAFAVASRRRPGVVLAVPLVAVVAWVAFVSAGSALFDWTA
jgi:hypothetical protein